MKQSVYITKSDAERADELAAKLEDGRLTEVEVMWLYETAGRTPFLTDLTTCIKLIQDKRAVIEVTERLRA